MDGNGCSGGDKRSDLSNQARETTAAEKVLQAESDRHQIRCGWKCTNPKKGTAAPDSHVNRTASTKLSCVCKHPSYTLFFIHPRLFVHVERKF